MQVLRGERKSSLAFWVCRRCLGTLAQAHASPTPSSVNTTTSTTTESPSSTTTRPARTWAPTNFKPRSPKPARNTQFFFVHEPITQHSRAIVKALQGKVSIGHGMEVFDKVKNDNRLHWSILSTYVPFLLSHRSYDEALLVMRDGVRRSMTHPHLYNLFLKLLVEKGQHDMAFSFLKEVGYTPYVPTVTKWLSFLTSGPDTTTSDKALELAEYLVTSTALTPSIVFPHLFKLLYKHKPAEHGFAILKMYKEAGESPPDSITLPLLNTVMIIKPDMDYLNRLINMTSTDILLKAIHWYMQETSNPLQGPLHIFYIISRYYPELKTDFFRTLGYKKFMRMWRYFARIIESKFDRTTEELRLEEKDSALLSALATLPPFGVSLLDRMVAHNVTVDSIYFEYKTAKELASDPTSLKAINPEREFESYCRAIEKYGVFPSAEWNCHMIRTFLRAGKVERAHEVFAWMKGENLDIKGVHLCFALYYVHSHQPDLAVNVILRNTIADGTQPTMEQCNQIVDMLGREGFLSAAKRVCNGMSNLLYMKPTIETQHIMLKNTIAHLGLEDGFIFLDKLLRWKVLPDKTIFVILLEAAIAAKRWEKIKDLRDSMRTYKIYLDMGLYNLLFNAYLQMGDEHEASDLMQRFVGVGHSPNIETYKILLQHHTAAKNTGGIIRVSNKLMHNPKDFIPDLKVDLVKAFLSINQLRRGFKMGRLLMFMGLTDIGKDLHDLLLYAACKTQDFELVRENLVLLMQEKFIPPSSSVIAMVLERMTLAKFDCTEIAALFGVPVPPATSIATTNLTTTTVPSVVAHSSSPSPPPTTTQPKKTISKPLHSPTQSQIPTPTPTSIRTSVHTPTHTPSLPHAIHATTPLPPPPNPTPTPTPTLTPTHTLTPTPKINPFASLFPPPPSSSSSTSPSPSTLRQDLSPLSPTSPIHSPSSPPASYLSRTSAYQFYDKYADLRESQKRQGLYSNYFESDEEVYFFGEIPEEKKSDDPFKQYVEYEEEVEDVKVVGKVAVVKSEEVQEEKRDFKLWRMFVDLKLW